MGKYRDIYIEDGKSLDDSGTYTVDIETADPISELWINFGATNGATSNKNSPIPACISKIEIIDGANVVCSLSGALAAALYFYQTGKLPELSISEESGMSQYASFPIRFGRWLWDTEFALIPAKFRNLQLKVTWDLAAINAVGATGFVTGSMQLWVVARVMEDLPAAPSAYLMHKNHMTFSTAASGDERVDLPSDYPYAFLMVRPHAPDIADPAVEMTDIITNLKLSLDHDKDIPFDLHAGDFVSFMRQEYPLAEVHIEHKGATAVARQVYMADFGGAQITVQSPDSVGGLNSLTASRATPRFSDYAGGAVVGDVVAQLLVRGFCIFNTMAYRFGMFEDPATYLNAPAYGDIKLILTQGNAGETCDVVLSQLRTYPT